mgnify:CR=1 FL=1
MRTRAARMQSASPLSFATLGEKMAALQQRGYDVQGFEASYHSDIPIGAGLSSSARRNNNSITA